MAKRAPLNQAEKEYIRQQKKAGASLAQIATNMGCSQATTRKWWRIARDQRSVLPRGRPKRGVLSTYPSELAAEAVRLKQGHPHWGPASVKLELKRNPAFSELKLPSHARLSAYFQLICPQAVQPRTQRPPQEPKRCKVQSPHQRWQVDGKEGVRVGSDFVTLLEMRELFCGLMIAAQAFITTTAKRWCHLTLVEVQGAFRQAFQTWGCPLEIQTDHEGVYYNVSDPQFPSLFTLWLVGLGISHVTSRSYRPTDQGAVERNHRTLGDFSWKDEQFHQVADLQLALDQHRQRYNTEFPSQAAHCHQQAPLLTFPTAIFTGRPFHPGQEWDIFNLQWVHNFLAQFVWNRSIATNGIVSLGHTLYPLGRANAGKRVSVRFQPENRCFIFRDPQGVTLAELPAQGLNKEDILGFLPAELALPVGYQFSLPFRGV
jgi:transposase-like protein